MSDTDQDLNRKLSQQVDVQAEAIRILTEERDRAYRLAAAWGDVENDAQRKAQLIGLSPVSVPENGSDPAARLIVAEGADGLISLALDVKGSKFTLSLPPGTYDLTGGIMLPRGTYPVVG